MLPRVGTGDREQAARRVRAARKNYEMNVHKITRKLGMFFDGEGSAQLVPPPRPGGDGAQLSTATSCSVVGRTGCMLPMNSLVKAEGKKLPPPPVLAIPQLVPAAQGAGSPRRADSPTGASPGVPLPTRKRRAMKANSVAWHRIAERRRLMPPSPYLTPLNTVETVPSKHPPHSATPHTTLQTHPTRDPVDVAPPPPQAPPPDLALLPTPELRALQGTHGDDDLLSIDVNSVRPTSRHAVDSHGRVTVTIDLSHREIRPVDVYEYSTYTQTIAHPVRLDLSHSTICRPAFDMLVGMVADNRCIVDACTENLYRKHVSAPPPGEGFQPFGSMNAFSSVCGFSGFESTVSSPPKSRAASPADGQRPRSRNAGAAREAAPDAALDGGDASDVEWLICSTPADGAIDAPGDLVPEPQLQQLTQRLACNRDLMRRRIQKEARGKKYTEMVQQRHEWHVAIAKLQETEDALRRVYIEDCMMTWRGLQDLFFCSQGKLHARLERARKKQLHEDRLCALLELEQQRRLQLENIIVRFQLIWWEKVELKVRGGLQHEAQQATSQLFADAAVDKISVKIRINDRKARELKARTDLEEEEAAQRTLLEEKEEKRMTRLLDEERKIRSITLAKWAQRVDLLRYEEGARHRVMYEEGEEWMWLCKRYEIAEERRVQDLEKQRKIIINKEKVIRERWTNQEGAFRTVLEELIVSCRGIVTSIDRLKQNRMRRVQHLLQPPTLAAADNEPENFVGRRYFLGQHISTYEKEPAVLFFGRSTQVDCNVHGDFVRKVDHIDAQNNEERATTYNKWCSKLEKAIKAAPHVFEQHPHCVVEHKPRLDGVIATIRGMIASTNYEAARQPTDSNFLYNWKEYIAGGTIWLRCVSPEPGDLPTAGTWRGEKITSGENQWCKRLDPLTDTVADTVQVSSPACPDKNIGGQLQLHIPRGATASDIEDCIHSCRYSIPMGVNMENAPTKRSINITVTIFVPYLDAEDMYLSDEHDVDDAPLPRRTWKLSASTTITILLCQPFLWIPQHLEDGRYKMFIEGDHIDKAPILNEVVVTNDSVDYDCGSEAASACSTPSVRTAGRPGADFLNQALTSGDLAGSGNGQAEPHFEGFRLILQYNEGYTPDDLTVFRDGGNMRYSDADRTIIVNDPMPTVVATVRRGTLMKYQANNVYPVETNDAQRIVFKVTSSKMTATVLRRMLQRLRYYNSSVDPVEGPRILSLTLIKGLVQSTVSLTVFVHAVDNPTVFHLPYTKKFYHFPCTSHSVPPHLKPYVKEDTFRPFSDGKLEDVDTYNFCGGYATFSIAYNAQKGDCLTFEDAVFRYDRRDKETSGLKLTLMANEEDMEARVRDGEVKRKMTRRDSLGPPVADTFLQVGGSRPGGRLRARSCKAPGPPGSGFASLSSSGLGDSPVRIEKVADEGPKDKSPATPHVIPVPQTTPSPSLEPVMTPPSMPLTQSSPQDRWRHLWNVRWNGAIVAVLAFYDTLDGDEGRRSKKGQAHAHTGRKESMPVVGRRAMAIHVDFTLCGAANLDAAQALIQAIVFVPVQMNRPGEYIRTLSCEFQVGITAGKKDMQGELLDAETCDPAAFQAPIRHMVQVKVTPPLATPISNKTASLAYREGAPAIRLGAFDSPADHSMTDTYLDGGFIAMEVIVGREVEHDVCGVREEGGITLKPVDNFITTSFYPWFLMMGERYEEGGKAKLYPPEPTASPQVAPVSPPMTHSPSVLSPLSPASSTHSPSHAPALALPGSPVAMSFERVNSVASLNMNMPPPSPSAHNPTSPRSRRRPRKSITSSLKVQVSDVFLDSKLVGTLHTTGSSLKLTFAKNRQNGVTRKELLTLLKSLTYGNVSKAPGELAKVLRVIVSDGTPILTQMIYELEIIPVDDVSEIILKHDKVRYRPCPDDAAVPFPIVPLGEGNIEDPDTDFFDGGYLEVSIAHGYNKGDTLSLLTEEQQLVQVARRQNPVLAFSLGRRLPRTATMPSLFAGARRKRGEAFVGRAQLGPTTGGSAQPLTPQASMSGMPLQHTMSEVSSISRQPELEVCTRLTLIEDVSEYVFDYKEAEKKITNVNGMFSGVVSNTGKKLRIDFPMPEQEPDSEYVDMVVTWEVVSYVLNCVTFVCDGSKGKFTQGPRTLLIKVQDAANPAAGKEKMVVEVKAPVFLLTPVQPYPVDVLQHPILPGKTSPIMPKVHVNCSDLTINTGYLHIEVVEGFTEGDTLVVNWKDGFVLKDNTVLAKSTNNYLASMPYNSPQCIGLEFNSKSKFSGTNLASILKSAAYKFAPTTELVKKAVLIAVATDSVARPNVETVTFLPPEAK